MIMHRIFGSWACHLLFVLLFAHVPLRGFVCLDDLCLDIEAIPRGTWQARGEMLYWRADGGGFDYAFPLDNVGRRRTQVLRGENHFGWRLGLGYLSCDECWIVDLSTLVLHARNDAQSNLHLGPRFGAFGLPLAARMRARLEHDYGNVDVYVGRYLWQSEFASMRAFAGLRSVWLRELRRDISEEPQSLFIFQVGNKENVGSAARGGTIRRHVYERKLRPDEQTLSARQFFPNAQARAREQMGFWGIGPGLGLSGSCGICEGFELVGRWELLALLGRRSHRIDYQALRVDRSGLPPDRRFPNETIVAPAFDFRLALKYGQQVDCFWMDLEVGFEHHELFGVFAPSLAAVPSVGNNVPVPSLSQQVRRDLSIGGPFISLRVNY